MFIVHNDKVGLTFREKIEIIRMREKLSLVEKIYLMLYNFLKYFKNNCLLGLKSLGEFL